MQWLNNKEEFHCALMSKKEDGHFINISPTICKKLNLKARLKVNAAFSILKNLYQFEMPEEVEEVLNTDPEANKNFKRLQQDISVV